MGRAILLVALILAALIIRQQLKSLPKAQQKKVLWKWLLVGLAATLVLLAATGRIHWIGAMIGASLPFFRRLMPLLIRFFPQIHHYYKTRSNSNSSNNQSEVKTQILNMILDHDSGSLSGTVLEGPLQGSSLDSLELEQLQSLLNYCHRGDQDSVNLLISYLDHRYGNDWQQAPAANIQSALSIDDAYAVLGLDSNASKEEVIKAHRAMMQKNHPDRGGSDYLAAQINEAKELIVRHLT